MGCEALFLLFWIKTMQSHQARRVYQPNISEYHKECTEIRLMLPETPIAMQLETTFEPRFAHANLIQCRTYFQNVINLPLMNYNTHFKSAKCMLHGMFFWSSNAILKSRSFKTCEDFEKTINNWFSAHPEGMYRDKTLQPLNQNSNIALKIVFAARLRADVAFQLTSTCLRELCIVKNTIWT